jgi:hypothetical protein
LPFETKRITISQGKPRDRYFDSEEKILWHVQRFWLVKTHPMTAPP